MDDDDSCMIKDGVFTIEKAAWHCRRFVVVAH